MGPQPDKYQWETIDILKKMMKYFDFPYEFNMNVTRGLSYYTRTGFEVNCELLGSQKQIAGGGVYEQGCGFAIGIDRCVIALDIFNKG